MHLLSTLTRWFLSDAYSIKRQSKGLDGDSGERSGTVSDV